MSKFIDLTGQKFGKLTVIERIPNANKAGRYCTMWACSCDCGNMTTVKTDQLKSGKTQSCSCLRKVAYSETHGMSKTPEHRAWGLMKDRTTNPNNKDFHHYGGRGITVCDRWLKFINFYADMGPRPSKDLSIDRIDNNKGYSPENCKWATRAEQAINRRTSIPITIDGVTKLRTHWFKYLNINSETYYRKKRKGFSDRESLGL